MKTFIISLLTCGVFLTTAPIFFPAAPPVFAAGAEIMTAETTKVSNDVTTQTDGTALFLTTTATYSAERDTTPRATSTTTTSITQITTQNATHLHQSATMLEKLQHTVIDIPTGFATSMGDLLNALLSAVMLIGALLVFAQLILAGFYWITSGGERGKIEAARQRLVSAVIGLIILSSSFAILNLGLNFLGFESLEAVFRNIKTIS